MTPRIVRTKGVCGGSQRLSGTRLDVEFFRSCWASGMTDEDILREYGDNYEPGFLKRGIEVVREWCGRSPRYSVRLGRERIDNEDEFECRRCLRLTPAIDGSDADEIDPHGDLCSECWCHIERFARRRVVPEGKRV